MLRIFPSHVSIKAFQETPENCRFRVFIGFVGLFHDHIRPRNPFSFKKFATLEPRSTATPYFLSPGTYRRFIAHFIVLSCAQCPTAAGHNGYKT
jgi:hypothetical protein